MLKKSLFLLSVLPVVGYSQSLDQVIDFHCEGKTLNQVLDQLTEKSGVKFEAHATLKNEFLVIKADQISVQDLALQIRDSVGGNWVKTNGQYKLVIDQNTINQETKTELTRAAQQLTTGVSKMRNADNFSSNYSATKQAENALQGIRPERGTIQYNAFYNALGVILKSENPNAFALLPNQRKVFSTRTTQMQVKMPSKMRGIIDNALKDHQNMIRTFGNGVNQQNRNSIPGTYRSPERIAQQLNLVYDKANLSVWRNERDYRFKLEFLDESGNVISSSQLYVPIDVNEYVNGSWNQVNFQPGQNYTADESTSKFFDFFVRSRTRATMLAPNAVQAIHFPFRSDLPAQDLQMVRNPLANDPLKELVGEPLYASQSSNKFIAVVPDELLIDAITSKSYSEFLGKTKDNHSWTQTQKEGWTIIKPTSTYITRSKRVDREALSSLINKMASNFGLVSLGDLSTYAKSHPEDVLENTWDRYYVRGLFSQDQFLQVYQSRTNVHTYLIHGLEGDNNGTMAYRNVSATGKNVLHDYVFNSYNGPQITNRVQLNRGNVEYLGSLGLVQQDVLTTVTDGTSVYTLDISTGGNDITFQNIPLIQQYASLGAQNFDFANTGYGIERTDRLPYGLPSDGQFQVSNRTQQMFLGLDPVTGSTELFSINTYAYQIAQSRYPRPGRTAPNPGRFTKFVLVEKQTASMFLRPMENINSFMSAEGYRIIGNVMDELPAQMKSQIDQSVINYERSLIDRMKRDGDRVERDSRRRQGDG